MSLGRLWPYQRCSSVQWYERETQAGWSYLAWSNPSPRLAALYEPFFGPTFGKHLLTLNRHFPFWQMSHTRRAAGWTSIWPLRYWTTALPVMLSAVSLSGHVERCSIFFFTAVESQLGWKTSEWSQLFHGGFCENHLIAGYSTVWSLDWQLRRRSWTNHNVGNEEPSSWNEKLFFIEEKQPFKGGRYTLGKNWPSSKQCLLSTMPSKSV